MITNTVIHTAYVNVYIYVYVYIGKSTIMRLIYRFFNLTGGRILIDGQDISLVKQSSLRSHIAIVPQDCVLFNDTIGYNIGYGIVGRRPSGATQDEIIEAAQRAQIYDHIVESPDQFDAKVGERGLRLSGGEKQRVAIARAILKAPSIMIFDEATSSLDTETEASIQRSLDEVSRGITSLTIAHRLSTIANSDIIFVLDKGMSVQETLFFCSALYYYATLYSIEIR
jgi:ABC-type transport system involved in Fe-S cluster assembly fused permease/ATPase subunit